MRKALLKDAILRFLLDNNHRGFDNHPTISELINHCDISETYTKVLVAELKKDDLMIYNHPYCKITNKGETFLTEEGGHIKLVKRWYHSIENWLKIAAILGSIVLGLIKLRSK